MSFDDFKEKIVSNVRQEDVLNAIKDAKPYYAHAYKDGTVFDGSFGDQVGLTSYCDVLRKHIKINNYDYTAIAVFSMVADLDSEEEAEALYDEIGDMGTEEMIRFLTERNLIQMSISIRFEQRGAVENSIVTFKMQEGKLTGHVEMFDTEVNLTELLQPFGGIMYED